MIHDVLKEEPKQSPIQAMIKNNHAALEDLQDLIRKLEEQLQPVLLCVPTEEKPEPGPCDARCDVTAHLEAHNKKIVECESAIRGMLERCEL